MTTYYGLDLLGGAKYQKEFLSCKTHTVGVFAEAFGDALPVIKKALRNGKRVRGQLVWDDDHVFGRKELQRAIELMKVYKPLVLKYGANLLISPFCEHRLSEPDKYLDKVQAVCPEAVIINCPDKGGNLSKKYANEVHGTDRRIPKGRYFYSYDGTSSVDSDVEKMKRIHKNAEIFYFWVPQFNLRKSENDDTIRPKRKAVPTPELIESVEYLANDRGETFLPKKFIWKSHADQHEVPPEPRASKPVLISPFKADEFQLVLDNGKMLAKLPYFGPFEGGGYRFYLGEYGYKISDLAIKKQGHPVLELKSEGKAYGKINPAFRGGVYRS